MKTRLIVVCKNYDKLLIDSVFKLMLDAIWSDDYKIVIVSQSNVI